MTHTKLAQVQTQVGSLHQAAVLTHGPNVVVHENRKAGECCHSQPHQEEQISQEHQLQTQGDKKVTEMTNNKTVRSLSGFIHQRKA